MIRIEQAEGAVPEAWQEGVGELFRIGFDGADPTPLFEQAGLGGATLTVVAFDGEQMVAFKLGTVRKVRQFHSAAGAVRPSHQRQGLARRMSAIQHTWAREQGFRAITTNTMADNLPMLLLNLHEGFRVIGTTTASSGGVKVQLLKQLDAQ